MGGINWSKYFPVWGNRMGKLIRMLRGKVCKTLGRMELDIIKVGKSHTILRQKTFLLKRRRTK